MLSRRLGNSDMEFSTIGLGTWAMGGEGWRFSWGHQEDHESITAIHRALELGVNWVDTAAVYGVGHAEEVLAQALQTTAYRPYIATKCGRLVNPDSGALYGSLKRESILNEVENSLRRLKVDIIDLYQIHWPDPDEQIEEGWSTLADLVKDGKVRFPAVSNFNVSQLKRIQPIYPVTSVQPPYSMLRRGIEDELINYCSENQIGIVVYSPMAKGLLTNKFTRVWVEGIPENDHRRRDENFQEPRLSLHLDLLEKLRTIAKGKSLSLAQLSIAWTLRHPAITSAIVGARRPSQIEETVLAGDCTLTDKEIQDIEDILQRHSNSIDALN